MQNPIEVEQLDGVQLVRTSGELDAFTVQPLRQRLSELIERDGGTDVVIDLAAVAFLDSTALGALVGAFKRLRERDGRLRIVVPETPAARIFELTGLDGILDLYPSRSAALIGMTAGPER